MKLVKFVSRWWGVLAIVFFGFAVYLLLNGSPAYSHFASWFIALFLLAFCSWLVLAFSEFFARTKWRVIIFAGILIWGSFAYFHDFHYSQKERVGSAEQKALANGPSVPSGGQAASGTQVSEEHSAADPAGGQKELSERRDYFFSVLLGIFSSLAEFFPSRGAYSDWLKYPLRWKIAFLVFYLLSYMFVALFLLSLLGRKLINRFRLLQTPDARKHVFWCQAPNRKEKLLAADIRRQNKRDQVIFSVKESAIEDTRTFVDQMLHDGYLLCLRKPGQFHDSDCLTAPRHFFLTEDFNWNFRHARKVLDRMQETGCHPDTVHFYIRVTADEKNYCAVRWADRQRQRFSWLKIHLIDEPSLAARMLQQEHPLLKAPGISIENDTCKVKGSFRVLLLGFSDGGQALLRDIVCNGQFLHSDPRDGFRVDVIDRNSVLTGGYIARYPDAIRAYNISFYNMDVLSGECYRWLEHNLFRYNRIIVAFWNDDLNLEVAAIISRLSKYLGLISNPEAKRRLEDLYPKIENAESKLKNLQKQKPDEENKPEDLQKQKDAESELKALLKQKADEESRLPEYMADRLFVRFSRSIAGSGKKKNGVSPDVFPEFRFFGSNEDCYQRKYIIDEELDDQAKRVHRIWVDANSPAPNKDDEEDWNRQDMFSQESNRASADGLYNLLRLMNNGKDFDRKKALGSLLAKTRELRENKVILETLSETEHLRWNAFHLMRGIRPWPLGELPLSDARNGKGKRKPNDIDSRLRHGAITDYSLLPEVDKRFGRGPDILQDNDRKLIGKMETILCDDPVKPSFWKKICNCMTSPFRRR